MLKRHLHHSASTDCAPFDAWLSVDGDDTIVWLSGEIDLAARPLVEALATCEPGDRMLVDMHEVTFLDSCGICALLRLRHTRERLGLRTYVVWPSPRVRATLRLAGLLDVLSIDPADGATDRPATDRPSPSSWLTPSPAPAPRQPPSPSGRSIGPRPRRSP